jgi:biotin transporter BioY
VSEARPITILIAALGGEGGGVLTDWIVAAATQCGFPIQSTSIPGVAQRTGATTYYIEFVPVARLSSVASTLFWRSHLVLATSTSSWRASCWKPAAASRQVS